MASFDPLIDPSRSNENSPPVLSRSLAGESAIFFWNRTYIDSFMVVVSCSIFSCKCLTSIFYRIPNNSEDIQTHGLHLQRFGYGWTLQKIRPKNHPSPSRGMYSPGCLGFGDPVRIHVALARPNGSPGVFVLLGVYVHISPGSRRWGMKRNVSRSWGLIQVWWGWWHMTKKITIIIYII